MEISEKNLFEVYGWKNGEEKRIRQKSEMLPFIVQNSLKRRPKIV